jgi:hypothetical protein
MKRNNWQSEIIGGARWAGDSCQFRLREAANGRRKRQWNALKSVDLTSENQFTHNTKGQSWERLRSDVRLTSEVSHIGSYWMRKSRRKVQAFEHCGRLTSPWISCQLNDVTRVSTGSINWSKTISAKHNHVSVIRYRDLLFSQKSEEWDYREFHRLSSKVRGKMRFFVRN